MGIIKKNKRRITTISLSKETKVELKKEAIHPRETYEQIIERLIDNHRCVTTSMRV